MIPEKVQELCRNGVSVSSELAQNPLESPGEICKRLYGVDIEDDKVDKKGKEATEITAADLEQAFACGNWGTTRPSEFFLRIYHDVLCTLEKNALMGVCSPSLLGTNGVSPVAIIAPLPEICRHMSNLIANAKEEVLLATNFWMVSEPANIISNSIRELSRRAVKDGTKKVVRMMYDRGNIKQLIKNHAVVDPNEYSDKKGKIQLPHPDETPNVDLEVMNFHVPMFGTFHAKFMIVDRKIAIVQSNNIQDNDNMEMMVQYEGDIVDSLYDAFLISYHSKLETPLPCLNTTAKGKPSPSFELASHAKMFDENGSFAHLYQVPLPVPGAEVATNDSTPEKDLAQNTADDPHYDIDLYHEIKRTAAYLHPREGETRANRTTKMFNMTIQPDTAGTVPDIPVENAMTPIFPLPKHDPFPMALVNREPWGPPNTKSLYNPQNQAFISALRHCKRDVLIQTPDLNAAALLPEILDACRRGINVSYYYCLGYNDAGELLPGQGGHNEMVANKLYKDLEKQYHDNLNIYAYTAKDMLTPLHHNLKKRSCHVKLMIVDGHIGIQGSGNQDTQSWYHSEEVNVMIDSEFVCGQWIEGIKRNQNTHLYGKVAKEGPLAGCWVDPKTGEKAEASIGPDPGHFAWAKGAIGAVQRVRGVGGF